MQPPTARILWHRPRPPTVGGLGARRRNGAGRYRCIDVSLVLGSVRSLNRIPVRSDERVLRTKTWPSGLHRTSTSGPPGTSSSRSALGRPARLPLRTPRRAVGCARLPHSCFLIWISTCVRLQLSRLEGLGVGCSAVRRSPSPRLGWEPGASVCCCGWRRCPQRRRTR